MEQIKLFGRVSLPDKKENVVAQNTCKTCKHRQRWQSDWGKKVGQCCGKRRSGRTRNGLLKIKCKNPACGFYQAEEGKCQMKLKC